MVTLSQRLLLTLLVMSVATSMNSSGDACFRIGMRRAGDVSLQLGRLPRVLRRVLASGWIWLGLALQVGFGVLWLAVLSWADLSVALPLSALQYVFGALLGRFWLREEVNRRRWAGTAVICAGVALVGHSMR